MILRSLLHVRALLIVVFLFALPMLLIAERRAIVKPPAGQDYKKKIDIPSGIEKMKPPPGVDPPVLMMTNKEKKGGRYDNPMDPPEWLQAKKLQPPGLPLTPPPPAPEMPPDLLTPVSTSSYDYGSNFFGGGQLVGYPPSFPAGTQEHVPGGFGRLRFRRRILSTSDMST